ncbi:aminotransferase class V-fold PLP-dependent enzyme [Janthinobacterium agaricidamnosum]|uniref:cysteine desulfurase n=1 Tax=Janthinobacterium agaricidamnosum NBRC 102515 = DSM 9628 TaxID=1349767 RepID=W0VE39_9BURK|nr:aminotransferase class V-fold PLP-dependent enzyme [Janthinobacterium agaricidamnosum]CDG85582.1 aminotransferase class-V family protein [Janthinobacterium agaricidamnosum NBRC 102515 = DSM 9628]
MTTEIYLDGNATSAVLPAAIAAATHVMGELYGNPSSTHATGLKAKALLDSVRARARRILGVGEGRLMFNSGATEGIQTAVLSALCALRERREAGEAIGALLLYGATEHKAVPESLAHWNRLLGLNLELRKLPVDVNGRHDLDVLRALAPACALVCTMAANNETGAISDLAGIEAVLNGTGSGAYWLVDCVQALGKLKLDLAATRIDYAPFSGHKLCAPKGIGMLYVRAGAPFTCLIMGGGQEAGQRSGTENMAGIAALGAVLAALEDGRSFCSHEQLTAFRARLVASLQLAFPGIVFNMPLAGSLPTTLNFSVPGFASKELLDLFDAARVRVSSGSACSAAKAAPSYVLEAMQVPQWRSSSAIRMSFGPLADEALIAAACQRIERCGLALRSSCLIPSELAPSPHDGLIQLGVDGACTWLLTDTASRSCVVIDALAPLTDRVAAYVRCQGYTLAAVLHTSLPDDEAGAARLALLAALDVTPAGCDAFGWPGAALVLGEQTLRRDGLIYLLGRQGAAPRFAFIGALRPEQVDSALVGADTLLCPAHDEHSRICSTLRVSQPDTAVNERGMHLDGPGLQQFLQAYPDALLVDVREPYEHAAGELASFGGRPALSVPLSRLAGYLGEWLQGVPLPLVFFCRSGNRSTKAASCLRRLGYAQAWHVTGGMALGEAMLGTLPLAA